MIIFDMAVNDTDIFFSHVCPWAMFQQLVVFWRIFIRVFGSPAWLLFPNCALSHCKILAAFTTSCVNIVILRRKTVGESTLNISTYNVLKRAPLLHSLWYSPTERDFCLYLIHPRTNLAYNKYISFTAPRAVSFVKYIPYFNNYLV